MVPRSQHLKFSDIREFLDLKGFSDETIAGKLNGIIGEKIITDFVGAFLKLVLEGCQDEILVGPNRIFPEVICGR